MVSTTLIGFETRSSYLTSKYSSKLWSKLLKFLMQNLVVENRGAIIVTFDNSKWIDFIRLNYPSNPKAT